jgi:hypothetical protein
MAGRVAPYIDNTGLVFAYDQANIVRSYLGEPTVNLATNTPSQGGWPGSYTVVDSANKTFDFTTSTVEWGGDASWTTFYYDVSAYTGQYVTISATFEYASDPNKFNFLWIGQTSGSETYLGYSPEADRNVKTTDDREDITWSGVVGSGGKVGILIWMSNGTSTTVTARISNVQVEVKSHATPFVNGTRSVTQGLKDLTGRSTIDLSNVSFDSNAQMTFDGTDDFIPLGNLGTIGSAYTLECVFNSTSVSSYRNVFDMNYNTYSGVTGNTGPRLEQTTGQGINFIWSGVTNSNNLYNYTNTISISANRNYHVAFVQDGSTGKMYLDGTLRDSANNTQGYLQTFGDAAIGRGFTLDPSRYFSGGVYIFKIYNRALTASEIRQNFNAVRGRYGI